MIAINELSKTIKEKSVLNNISLTMDKGKTYLVTGTNGAGKSTFLKIIAGTMFPSKGTCLVDNYIPGKRLPSFLESIYFLPQFFSFDDKPLSYFLEMNKYFYPLFDNNKFASIISHFFINLDSTSLAEKDYRCFLLSFAFATHVKYLLLDEPAIELNPPQIQTLLSLLVESLDPTRTIIITTRNPEIYSRIADEMIIIDSGEILLKGNISEISSFFDIISFNEKPKHKKCVYYQGNDLEGYRALLVSDKPEEKEIDLSFLLSGIIAGKTKIKSMKDKGDIL